MLAHVIEKHAACQADTTPVSVQEIAEFTHFAMVMSQSLMTACMKSFTCRRFGAMADPCFTSQSCVASAATIDELVSTELMSHLSCG